ncbi:glycosyltransferase [bacterium]|nr:glycosyltransferase [bacterium]
MVKISVIIPIFNVEKYLRQCLDSVINQTLKDIEIICIDDGSTDNSGKILDEYVKKDNRVKVIHKKNTGYGNSINMGIDIVTGEYIGIVESDDYIEPNMYETLYNDAINNDADIVKGQYYILTNPNTDKEEKLYELKHKNIPSESFNIFDYPQILLHHASIWSAIYKTNFIKSNKIRMFEKNKGKYADQVWRFEAMCLARKIFIEKQPLYNYRMFSIGNTTSQKGATTPDDIFDLYEELNKFFEKHDDVYEQIKECYFCEIFWHTLFNLQRCDKSCHRYILDKFKRMFENQIDYNFINKISVLSIEDKKKFKALLAGKYKTNKQDKMTFLQHIFSIRNENIHKEITIFGAKIKIKNKYNILNKLLSEQQAKVTKLENYINDLRNEQQSQVATLENNIQELMQNQNYSNNLICDLYIDSIILDRKNKKFDFDKFISGITCSPEYLCIDSNHNYLNILINQDDFYYKAKNFNQDKTIISWEMARWVDNLATILYSIKQNKNIIFIGDSFLRSINTMADRNAQEKYRKGISFGVDDLGYYYDATRTNRMEQMLNDKSLVINEEQKQRARYCIDKIVETNLTKYNHQPIYEPNIGRDSVRKVLVVDQSYGDMSILKGLADENTFKDMLQAAIDENPDADIIVKTHPDTIAGAGGYFKGLEAHDNIYTQTEPINPISLIKYVDKVYVCTTQFGFEALMCGKEVHVFGMPFYAGWGLTHDRQKCERRTNTRTLEEVFYIAYIMYSYYVNPDKKCRCEIEEAMDYLLKLRDEYFNVKEND